MLLYNILVTGYHNHYQW